MNSIATTWTTNENIIYVVVNRRKYIIPLCVILEYFSLGHLTKNFVNVNLENFCSLKKNNFIKNHNVSDVRDIFLLETLKKKVCYIMNNPQLFYRYTDH